MPLLRQALYAQNINLYLAPTADGRDGWASLMRTVGTEGRCFVVSSNMAVRDGQPSSQAVHDDDETEEQQRLAASAQNASHGRRRNSCLTEEGNEIVFPTPANTTAARRPRRESCVTEEGHEIALPSEPSPASSPAGTKKRRKSVVVQDGHEIVLGCDDDGAAKKQPAANGTNSQTQDSQGWVCRGGSIIVDPFGEVLAGPQWEDDEGIIYADVDFEDCVRGRLDLDAAGSYSRYICPSPGTVCGWLTCCRNDSFKFSVEGLDLEPLPY